MIRKLALIVLVAVLLVPALAEMPEASQNGTADMVVPLGNINGDIDPPSGITFIVNSPTTTGDPGSGHISGSASVTEGVVTPVELAADLDEAESDIAEAREVIESDPDTASSLLSDAADTQDGVNVIMATDLNELETEIEIEDVEELGLDAEDITEGERLLEEAQDLIEQADAETDLTTRADLLEEALELQREAIELIPEVDKIASDSDTAETTGTAVETAMRGATTDAALSALQAIAEAIPSGEEVTISRSFETFQITNTEVSDEVAYRTKIKLTITAGKDLKEVTIVEVIPKSVAAEVAMLIFKTVPEVLQDDPIVQWTLENLPRGSSTDLSYVVKDKILSLDSTTLATVEAGPLAEIGGEIEIPEPPKPKKPFPLMWLGLLVLILAAGYYYTQQKK